jgi:hypothetical protein
MSEPRSNHFGLRAVLGFGTLMLCFGVALSLFVQSRTKQAVPLASVAALPALPPPDKKFDPLAFEHGEYLVAPNSRGKFHVFRVMGHVSVRLAARHDGKMSALEPIAPRPNPERRLSSETPLTARFDEPFALELLMIGAPVDSVEEARRVVREKAGSGKEPSIHVLDLHQSVFLTIQSVIRLEVHR